MAKKKVLQAPADPLTYMTCPVCGAALVTGQNIPPVLLILPSTPHPVLSKRMEFKFEGVVGVSPDGQPIEQPPEMSWDDQLDQRAAMGADVTEARTALAAWRERLAQAFAEMFLNSMKRQGHAHGVDVTTWIMWSAQQRCEAFVTKYRLRTAPSGQPIWTKAEIAAEPPEHIWTLVRHDIETEYAWPSSNPRTVGGERFGYLVTTDRWLFEDAHGVWRERDRPKVEDEPSPPPARGTRRRPSSRRRG